MEDNKEPLAATTFFKLLTKHSIHRGCITSVKSYGAFVELERFNNITVLCNIPYWNDGDIEVGVHCLVEISRIRKSEGKVDGRIKKIIHVGTPKKSKIIDSVISDDCVVHSYPDRFNFEKNDTSITLTKEEMIAIFKILLKNEFITGKDIVK